MKYRAKPLEKEATQWFKNGDHPLDGPKNVEGKIVRYFRHPQRKGSDYCPHCHNTLHIHGWIDTLEGGHTVCPGDFIITGVHGEFYPCKPQIFKASYTAISAVGEKK